MLGLETELAVNEAHGGVIYMDLACDLSYALLLCIINAMREKQVGHRRAIGVIGTVFGGQ